MAKARNYTRERKVEKPARKAQRAARNRARRAMGLKVGDGKSVSHKRPLSKGGSNNKSNLSVTTPKKNSTQGGKLGRGKQKPRRKR